MLQTFEQWGSYVCTSEMCQYIVLVHMKKGGEVFSLLCVETYFY